jgi:hypothetical protein
MNIKPSLSSYGKLPFFFFPQLFVRDGVTVSEYIISIAYNEAASLFLEFFFRHFQVALIREHLPELF